MKKTTTLFSSAALKIIALLTMTIDHLAIFLYDASFITAYEYIPLRVIGRLAFPLFAFMIVEGVLHTKNLKQYLLRLALMLGIILSFEFFAGLTGFFLNTGNIFIDLLTGALLISFINQPKLKNSWMILPTFYLIFLTLADFGLFNLTMPRYLYPQYNIFGTMLMVGFFLASRLSRTFAGIIAKRYQMDVDGFMLVEQYQVMRNILSCVSLLFVTLVWYILSVVNRDFDIMNMAIQSYAILAGFALIFYSGKRGYHAKWFQYGSYLYYPLHLIALYGIFQIINLIN